MEMTPSAFSYKPAGAHAAVAGQDCARPRVSECWLSGWTNSPKRVAGIGCDRCL